MFGFGINRYQNDGRWGFQVVNRSISAAFAARRVAVTNADFENCIARSLNFVANQFPALDLVNEWLNIRPNVRILACQSPNIPFELWRKENLHRWLWAIGHLFLPTDFR